MPSKHGKGRLTLCQGLDREVYQVIRKITDEHSQYGDSNVRLSFALIYDEIRRSNSSLNRKNKKLLQESIERVLETIQHEPVEDSGSDPIEGEYDGLDNDMTATEKPVSNGLNKSIVGMWATSAPKTSITTKKEQELEQRQETSETATLQALPTNKRRQATGEPPAKKRKAGPSAIDKSPPTHVSLADLGGVDSVIQQFEDLLVLPMTRPEIYSSSKVQPPRGVLIHGPPGCGKTMIANAFAAELGVSFIAISAPSIVSGMSGESEKALRDHFEEAKKAAPCLIFIDEIDAITPKRESAQREMEKRIVAQLLTCMDDLALEKTDGKPVIVLAATNRPDSLDAALRRGGRFDKEINMSVPSEPVREQILRALTRQTNLADDVDFALLAKRTPGFVGADLNDLVSTSGAAAIRRYLNILKSNSESASMEIDAPTLSELTTTSPSIANIPVSPVVTSLRRLIKYAKETSSSDPITSEPPTILVTNADFLTSLPQIQPSSLREGFATIPTTTFADIGALNSHRAELLSTIILPILSPALYSSVGISSPSGLLLWGPPGCGKTLLAKAVANESKANFISVKGPELLNKYVGESERAVRQVFNRARSSVPVVIFFDELDALVPRRSDGAMSEASARVVNTLLTELDGIGSGREGIYVLAATNRPDIIDPAMLRPGRLETLLFVGLPSPEERVEIFKTLIERRLPASSLGQSAFSDELAQIARSCDGFSGADLESLLRRAGYAAIKRSHAAATAAAAVAADSAAGEPQAEAGWSAGGGGIQLQDFVAARGEVRRSVRVEDMRRYEKLRSVLGSGGVGNGSGGGGVAD